MATPDQDIEILINTVLNATGYRMNEIEARKLKQQIDEVSASTDQLSDANKKGAKESEHAGIGHSELHKILHLISSQSGPEAGAALATLGAIMTGSFGLGVMGARELFEWLRRIQERAAEARAEAAQLQTAVWDSQREGAQRAKEAAEDYFNTLKKIMAVSDQLKQHEDLRKAVLDAQIEAAKKLLDYQEKQALLAANGNKEEEARIKAIFEGQKSTAEMQGAAADIARQRQDLESERTNAALAKRRYDDAVRAQGAGAPGSEEAAKAKTELDILNGGKNSVQALLQQLFGATGLGKDGTLEAARAAVERMRREMESMPDVQNPEGGPTPRDFAAIRYGTAQKALEAAEAAKQKQDALQRVLEEHTAAEERLKKTVDDTKSEFEKLRDQAAATRAALEKAETVYKIQTDEARQEGKKPPGIPDIGPPRGGGTVATPEQMQRNQNQLEDQLYAILREGGKLSPMQEQQLQAILRLQTGHTIMASRFMETLNKLYSDVNALEAAMARQMNEIMRFRQRAGY